AAALAIVVQARFLADIMLKETKRTGYETASAPSTDPGVGAFALIRFAPQASSDDVTKFLEANKLSIAAGPMAGGLYKVRVAVTGIPKGTRQYREEAATGQSRRLHRHHRMTESTVVAK
ncbi:MAG: hypothetical protein WAN49_13070, partial [Pseudolabrys sp.]